MSEQHVLDREKTTDKQKLEPPKKHHVFILNDDFSSFELVIDVCMKYFHQTEEQASRTAMDVHTKGKGLGGTYPKDIAQTKVMQVNSYAQENGQPLKASTEEE